MNQDTRTLEQIYGERVAPWMKAMPYLSWQRYALRSQRLTKLIGNLASHDLSPDYQADNLLLTIMRCLHHSKRREVLRTLVFELLENDLLKVLGDMKQEEDEWKSEHVKRMHSRKS